MNSCCIYIFLYYSIIILLLAKLLPLCFFFLVLVIGIEPPDLNIYPMCNICGQHPRCWLQVTAAKRVRWSAGNVHRKGLRPKSHLHISFYFIYLHVWVVITIIL